MWPKEEEDDDDECSAYSLLAAEREGDPYAVTSGRHGAWNADFSKQQQHSR